MNALNIFWKRLWMSQFWSSTNFDLLTDCLLSKLLLTFPHLIVFNLSLFGIAGSVIPILSLHISLLTTLGLVLLWCLSGVHFTCNWCEWCAFWSDMMSTTAGWFTQFFTRDKDVIVCSNFWLYPLWRLRMLCTALGQPSVMLSCCFVVGFVHHADEMF